MPNTVERGHAAKHSTCTSSYYRIAVAGQSPNETVSLRYLITGTSSAEAIITTINRFRATYPLCEVKSIRVTHPKR